MTDAAADALAAQRARIEARLKSRYRAERRFRIYGLAAIGIAVASLLVLVGSIATQAYSAFWNYELSLEVTIDPDRVPDDPAALRRGDYGVMLQEALRVQFPDETETARVRELLALYNRLNATRLGARVAANPDLVGRTVRFSMPISDEVDRYLKGFATQREWVALAAPPAIAPASEDGAPVTIALSATDAGRIAAELDDADPSVAAREAILFASGGAWRLTRIAGPASEGEILAAPTGADTRARVLVLYTPGADRRISPAQIAWTEILRERGAVKAAFNTALFVNTDSREPELAGVLSAMVGSLLTMMVTMVLAVPVGVATALYLEEFAPRNRWTDMVEVNINNLAAVPSIVFGLLGLAVFINFLGLPRSAPLVGGLVLALMTLPVVIIATRAALKAVPPSIRQGALAIGASRTQAVFGHVLPLAAPGIMTGSIIGLAHALGETAPLLMIGMVAFVADVPAGVTSPSTVMPVQIYMWATSAERAFEPRTAAAIIILLTLMVTLNGAAIFLRRKFERRW
jgi:phosphate transport system permease protein